jgi:hypothetical protein
MQAAINIWLSSKLSELRLFNNSCNCSTLSSMNLVFCITTPRNDKKASSTRSTSCSFLNFWRIVGIARNDPSRPIIAFSTYPCVIFVVYVFSSTTICPISKVIIWHTYGRKPCCKLYYSTPTLSCYKAFSCSLVRAPYINKPSWSNIILYPLVQ